MREEEKLTSLDSKWKRIMRKKWVLPAVYIGSAALILAGVLWYQASTSNLLGGDATDNVENVADNQYSEYTQNQEAVPVNATEENIQMPVLDETSVVIKKEFYEVDASSEEQEAALVFFNNTYYPSTGVDIAQEDGKSFDVVASLSGTVVRAENDSILGNVVEIEHEGGVSTFYQSLDEMHVEAGVEVEQGEVLGTAGTSVYNKDVGVHVHFEIRHNNEPVNPIDFFNKPLSAVEKDIKENTAKTGESAEQPKQEKETDSTENADPNATEKADPNATEKADPNAEKEADKPADESNKEPTDKKEENSDGENSDKADQNEQENNEATQEDASISMTRA